MRILVDNASGGSLVSIRRQELLCCDQWITSPQVLPRMGPGDVVFVNHLDADAWEDFPWIERSRFLFNATRNGARVVIYHPHSLEIPVKYGEESLSLLSVPSGASVEQIDQLIKSHS